VGCGGACVSTSPSDRQLRPVAIDTAISLARQWASSLVELHGLAPRAAAHLAARRYGVDADDLYIVRDARLARVWARGALARPTVRPTRSPIENEETDMENNTERGAA
jgi:hypothetical protein